MPSESHIVSELGMHVASDGAAVLGRAEVRDELCVPGTEVLRTSVLGTWADVVTGAVAGLAIEPRIPLTLDLEVQLRQPVRLGTVVIAEATAVKVGRTVVVTTTQFRDAATRSPLATSFASFVPSADPAAVFPDGFPLPEMRAGTMTVPLADRIGSRLVAAGAVEVPHRPDGLNAVGAIQGGLLAFGAEEAAASLAGGPVLAESLVVRYLRPIVVGPGRAVAVGESPGASVVHVTDAGSGKLGVVATVRTVTIG